MGKSVDQVLRKWGDNTAGAVQSYKEGVMGVREAPGAKAAAQKEAYRQGTAAAADKFAARVGAVTLSSWQQSSTTKGAANIATGVEAAKPKMRTFLQQFLPFVEQAKATLDASTPRGPKRSPQNRQRMLAMLDMMTQFQRT